MVPVALGKFYAVYQQYSSTVVRPTTLKGGPMQDENFENKESALYPSSALRWRRAIHAYSVDDTHFNSVTVLLSVVTDADGVADDGTAAREVA